MGGGKLQERIASMVVKRRAPKVTEQYAQIGGSPIGKWTQLQFERMCALLDEECPDTAPHKPYIAFRYASPLTHEALEQMRADGVKRAVAFSQYPQWCCSTTGSSMNQLRRELARLDMSDDFEWSLIDRWYLHPGYVAALSERIATSLAEAGKERETLILFSAHSVPMKTVTKGDPYVFEVSATVKAVVQHLRSEHSIALPHQLSWQSKVGYLPWMTPSTHDVLQAVGKRGKYKTVLVVPFVFTSDHVETLYELDIEYAKVASDAGIERYVRVPALNDSPLFVRAQADIVKEHLAAGDAHSDAYLLRCHGCVNEACRPALNGVSTAKSQLGAETQKEKENVSSG